jgi:Cupin domain
MEAGADTSLHLHRRKATWLDVLGGFGTLIMGGELPLAPGATFHVPAGHPHRLRAAWNDPLVVWELESPPDKGDILRLVDRHGRAGQAFPYGSRILSGPEHCIPSPVCEASRFEQACIRLGGLVASGKLGRAAGSVEQLVAGARRWTLVRRSAYCGRGGLVDHDPEGPSSLREAK